MGATFDHVLQLRLDVENVQSPVWRRFQVPSTYTFWSLHCAIQRLMGFDFDFTFVFHAKDADGKLITFTMNDSRTHYATEYNLSWLFKLTDYLPVKGSRVQYFYDLWSPWLFSIELEGILPSVPGIEYPRCLDGERAILEDCSGSLGFAETLEILRDSEHPAFESIEGDVGDGFDPEAFDARAVRFDDPEDVRIWTIVMAPVVNDLIESLPDLKAKVDSEGRHPVPIPVRFHDVLIREGLLPGAKTVLSAPTDPTGLLTVFLSRTEVDVLVDAIGQRLFEKTDVVIARQLNTIQWYVEHIQSALNEPGDDDDHPGDEVPENHLDSESIPLPQLRNALGMVEPDPTREITLAAATFQMKGFSLPAIVCLSKDSGQHRFVATRVPFSIQRRTKAAEMARFDLTRLSNEFAMPRTDLESRILMLKIGYGIIEGMDFKGLKMLP